MADATSGVKVGVIGGSGLGQLLSGQTAAGDAAPIEHDLETPFGKPSDLIREIQIDGLPVFFLARHGPGHLLNPSQVPFRANLFALKSLGVTHILASGAVGSLRDEFRPRDLVIADQIIDKTNKRANTFYEKAAVHAEFAHPFCPVLRQTLIEEGKKLMPAGDGDGDGGGGGEAAGEAGDAEPVVHARGCYVCMEGPAFSTRAESLMHRLWGGDLIGMTAMPEAKLAREAEISYALIALVTDYDCWKQAGLPTGPGQPAKPDTQPLDPAALLKEIIANLQAASDNGLRLIRGTLARIAADEALRERLETSPARSALKLAIWSDKSRIDRDEVQRLGPLWGKYFE